jgi:hypothetical protein
LCGRFPDRRRLGLVLRGTGVEDDAVAKLVGAPVVARMSDQRGLTESIDLGFGPVRTRRSPLGRAAACVLSGLRSIEASAA